MPPGDMRLLQGLALLVPARSAPCLWCSMLPFFHTYLTWCLRCRHCPFLAFQVILALGIALCVIIVILAKKALKKITEQELEHERQLAAEAEAAAAAEAGTAGPDASQPWQRSSLDSLQHQKQPLPLAIEGKLAGADTCTPLDNKSLGSGSDGDLQVIVMDNPTSSTNTTTNPMQQDSGLSRESSLIPTAQPPAAAGADASTTSRGSSVSSMRGLLTGVFQRSS